ncbi:protein indeterminate-domain 7-like [Coffea arabica]|uniref:Protein indeterminate-domain 7-like n=1 Tax=Coffea arabica TaxID=13443 RepID=A0A6P6XLL2_COFAR
MMKGLIVQQQPAQPVMEENMSNLTSASNEASVSSVNRNDNGSGGSIYPPQQYFAPPNQTQVAQPQQAVKKKRNLPGNPDPDAEVLALSPKTLLATNRFICEICNKGFQRDQNLQLHRRGHNLPWKLKQRTNKEVKKKVYVCPEASCVHHDPSRALGDLTGIKKHFCRKHGEKKWKCDKCSKRYAVQSDWKAHSKTCGTREYRCDCGTLFSRRDSFITHRAFCDALAEESARAIPGNPLLSSQAAGSSTAPRHVNNINPLQQQFGNQDNPHLFSLKKEQHTFNLRPEIPPWLACSPMPAGAGPGPGPPPVDLTSSIFPSPRLGPGFSECHQELSLRENPNPNLGPNLPPFHPTTSPHISATALLQKAAQMGAAMGSSKAGAGGAAPPAVMLNTRPHQAHVSAAAADSATNITTGNFGLNLSSREDLASGTFVNGLASYGNKAVDPAAGGPPPPTSFLQDMMMNSLSSSSATTGFEGSTFEDAFGGILNPKKTSNSSFMRGNDSEGGGGGGGIVGGGNDRMTRDFLGLRPLSHSDIFNIAGFSNCMNTTASNEHHQNASQKSWQG